MVSWWNGHLARFMVEWASCPFHGGMGILPVSWWNGHLARFMVEWASCPFQLPKF
ncbi:MAG: hypothetical protein F6J94_28525 [Moorea sp. SIO1F2]|uniref:hypothetical protein n=1 Tax=Moorena sp. SIO1F2 TaxID=2607819 RepID=UPI0013B83A4A|nr:hypothetical protein [Moorena sp. SIO1F2]NET85698.1 hypothetical protein [Moorena sp. SIO1F2]